MPNQRLGLTANTIAVLGTSIGIVTGGLLLPTPLQAASNQAPKVVVSIKPVHSLVSNVMAGVGKPDIIITGGASPHSYSLRPSKARMLNKADIVFWVGDEMETFLKKPLHSLSKKATIIELSKAPGVHLLKARTGGTWEAHLHEEDGHDKHGHDNHGHEKHGHDKHGHEKHDRHDHGNKKEADKHKDEESHGEYNMHIWLGRANAIAIVQAAVKSLSNKDSSNSSRYKKNGDRTIKRINKLYRTIKQNLAPVKQIPYLVFHDAYHYFEQDVGLNVVGSISTQTATKPGAKILYEIRKKILSLGVKCIFSEPQFKPAIVKTLIAGTSAKTGVLDPLGANLKSGPDAYFSLVNNLSKNLKTCLSKTS